MGQLAQSYQNPHKHDLHCLNKDAPICGNRNCQLSSVVDSRLYINSSSCESESKVQNSAAKELVIIGAGPHALTLLLRLIEPEADLLSEKERHLRKTVSQNRPFNELYRHIKDISRGRTATLKSIKKRGNSRLSLSSPSEDYHPPLPIDMINDFVQVVDAHGGWMSSWKQNFEAIGISQLRSLMNAHADPFDHRSLEFYAKSKKRDADLVTLDALVQRDSRFRGPYQVPSTQLFHDFHEALVKSYGITDVVEKGKVLSVTPMKDDKSDENIFEVRIDNGTEISTIKTRRCVCALGPSFAKFKYSWEETLQEALNEHYHKVSKRILCSDEIVQFLLRRERDEESPFKEEGNRLLIVGGGITSAQIVLRVLNTPFCDSVTFIQRSKTLIQHFDIENAWMGPKRGKLMEGFFSRNIDDRPKLLKDARRGGSIPPELFKELQRQEKLGQKLICKEDVEISHVEWSNGEFYVTLDDQSFASVDFIWLVTGFENTIHSYPVLDKLRETLPLKTVNGLPVLSSDLSWGTDDNANECKWKRLARSRFWCMGALAGLQLGPDSLNIVGARHGAVKVAKAIRSDMENINLTTSIEKNKRPRSNAIDYTEYNLQPFVATDEEIFSNFQYEQQHENEEDNNYDEE